jgi:hypothetical protein
MTCKFNVQMLDCTRSPTAENGGDKPLKKEYNHLINVIKAACLPVIWRVLA